LVGDAFVCHIEFPSGVGARGIGVRGAALLENNTNSYFLDPAKHHPALITNFLSQPDRLFGAKYGENWATRLWMVYAQADKRWGEADTGVISLELLTVLGAGPLALYICAGIARRNPMVGFWMVVLATAELYGGQSPFHLSYSLSLFSFELC
jgi:hypothetical protein